MLLKGAAKIFKAGLQSKTWDIHGMPHFVTTMDRKGCDMCEAYALHVVGASRAPMVEILSREVDKAFHIAWLNMFAKLRMKHPQNPTKRWNGTVTAITI